MFDPRPPRPHTRDRHPVRLRRADLHLAEAPRRLHHNVSINTLFGVSPGVSHFFFQPWTGVPFGFAILFFSALMMFAIWRETAPGSMLRPAGEG